MVMVSFLGTRNNLTKMNNQYLVPHLKGFILGSGDRLLKCSKLWELKREQ